MTRLARLLFLVAVLALGCSACRLSLDVAMDLNRNGGGRLAVAVAADEELTAAAEEAGASPLDSLAERAADLEGWSVDDSESEGTRTVTLSAGFADPAEFEALTAELAEALDTPEVTLLELFSLDVEEMSVRVRGGAGLEPTRAVRDYGVRPRQLVRRLERTEAFSYTVSATFPGEVEDAAGAAVEGRTAVWTVPPGEAVVIDATAARPPIRWIPLAIAAVGLVITGVALLWWFLRRGTMSP